MLNGICDKKFAEEKHYANGAQAYLFRNAEGECLQVLWLDDRREDVSVPLPAGQEVELIYLDGSRTTLNSVTGAVTVSLSEEPLLLLYDDESQGLASELGDPAVALAKAPEDIEAAGTSIFSVNGPAVTVESLRVGCPPLWKTTLRQQDDGVCEVAVQAPGSTPAREGRISVQLLSDGTVVGELTVPVDVVQD